MRREQFLALGGGVLTNDKARLEGAEEKGATVNPLNFAAAERDTNSFRGRFDFDFEGDSVVDHPNIGNLPGARLT